MNARETIEAIGVEPITFVPSVIGSSSVSVGDAGNVTIDTARAILRDGGRFSSGIVAIGNGGNLVLNATEFVEVSGTVPGSINPSTIDASATIIDDITRQIFGVPPVPSGSPGNLEINTPRLRVFDGGLVTVRNDGTGSAGNLQVNAGSIFLDGGGSITASTQSGGGGNLQLSSSGSLQLSDGGFISAEAGGTGNGGNIAIATGTIALIENSSITANAIAGNGGNIAISTQGLFASPESSITASSQFGVDGIVEITNPEIDTDAGLADLSDEVPDPAERVSAACSVDEGSSFTRTGRGGLPDDPVQPLPDRALWRDWRDYGQSNSITATAKPIPQLEDAIATPFVEANTWRVDPDGTVALLAAVERSPHLESPPSCRSHISQQ